MIVANVRLCFLKMLFLGRTDVNAKMAKFNIYA